MKLIPMPKHFGLSSGVFTKEPSAAIWTDPSNKDVLEQLKNGQITIRHAAELLGIEPTLLAYQLSGKVNILLKFTLFYICTWLYLSKAR